MALEEWDRIPAVNLTGVFLHSREAVRAMIPNKSGTIVNIGSYACFFGFPAIAASCSTFPTKAELGTAGYWRRRLDESAKLITPEGCIGANRTKRNYVKYVIERLIPKTSVLFAPLKFRSVIIGGVQSIVQSVTES